MKSSPARLPATTPSSMAILSLYCFNSVTQLSLSNSFPGFQSCSLQEGLLSPYRLLFSLPPEGLGPLFSLSTHYRILPSPSMAVRPSIFVSHPKPLSQAQLLISPVSDISLKTLTRLTEGLTFKTSTAFQPPPPTILLVSLQVHPQLSSWAILFHFSQLRAEERVGAQ